MKQSPIKGNPRSKRKGSLGKSVPEIGVVKDNREDVQSITTVAKTRRKTAARKRIPESKQRNQVAKIGSRRTKKRISKGTKLTVAFAALLVVLLGGLGVVQFTGALNIKNVEYVGADHLTQAECEALARKPIGESLLFFDSGKIEAGMTRTTWVESVSFERVFPDTLRIQVKEREIGAVVEFQSGSKQISQSWIITRDGMWIMAIPEQTSETGMQISQNIYADAESAVHITDCPNGIAPQLGASCTDTTVLNALAILNGMTTSLKEQVKTISVPSVSGSTVKLDNNIEIAFGQADQIREKERIVNEIIAQNAKVVYVNVRTVDRPTWRAA